MNIFIYGNQSFKKDIQKILKNSKINKVLDDLKIVEINELKVLKENIASNPNDIYLIDDDSIIRKKSKFNFFKPKDGVEEEFLLECGVDDLSIDSLDDLPNYIIRKHNRQNLQNDKAKVDEKPLEQDNISIDLKVVAAANSEPNNEKQASLKESDKPQETKKEDNQNSQNETNIDEIIEDTKAEESSENNGNQDSVEEAVENVEDVELGQEDIDNILEAKEDLEELDSEAKEENKDDEADNLDSEIQENSYEVKPNNIDENDIIDEENKDDKDQENMQEEKQDNDFSSLENFSEDVGLNNVSYDYDDNTILNDNAKNDEELLADILSPSSLNEEYLNSATETFEDVNFLGEVLPEKQTLEDKEIEGNTNDDEKLEEVIAVDDKSNNENQAFFTESTKVQLEENDKSQEIKAKDSQNSENEIDIEELIEKGWAEESLKESKNQDNTKLIEDEDIDLINDLEDFTDEKREIILKSDDKNDEAKNIQSLVTNLDKEESVKNIDGFEESIQGSNNMSDEFFELDSLSEQDLIAALASEQSDIIEAKNETKTETKSAETIALNGSKKEDIADLISQLLNNKTLEITIKAKD